MPNTYDPETEKRINVDLTLEAHANIKDVAARKHRSMREQVTDDIGVLYDPAAAADDKISLLLRLAGMITSAELEDYRQRMATITTLVEGAVAKG